MKYCFGEEYLAVQRATEQREAALLRGTEYFSEGAVALYGWVLSLGHCLEVLSLSVKPSGPGFCLLQSICWDELVPAEQLTLNPT